MRSFLKKANEVLSWVLMFGAIVLLIITIFNVSKSVQTGEGAFLFGYRPVVILTGSMEPYLKTNGICLTKQVSDISEIDVGDVITFKVTQKDGSLTITHRIVRMEDGYIFTKGDNNRIEDNIPLTMENVEAKVTNVFNETAWVVANWQTRSGKIMLISFALFFILAYFSIKNGIQYLLSKKDKSEEVPEQKTGNPITEKGSTERMSSEFPNLKASDDPYND